MLLQPPLNGDKKLRIDNQVFSSQILDGNFIISPVILHGVEQVGASGIPVYPQRFLPPGLQITVIGCPAEETGGLPQRRPVAERVSTP